MAGDLLNIGTSGLVNYQNALSVTSNNIENIYTPGYNRRVVDFTERGSQGFEGVDIASKRRIVSGYIDSQLRHTTTNFNRLSAYNEQVHYLDDLLGNEAANLDKGIQDFFTALNTALANPASSSQRQLLFTASEALVDRLQGMQTQFNQQLDEVNQALEADTKSVNALLVNFADLNRQIANLSKESDQDALLGMRDNRDQVLRQIAEFLPIHTNAKDDGSIDIVMGSGDALVLGGQAMTLTTQPNPNAPQQLDCVITTPFSSKVLSRGIDGGRIGGLLDFRDKVLQPSSLELGRLSLALADNFNQQHRQGMDVNNELGKDFFTDINSASLITARVRPNTNNTGSATMAVNVTDTNLLQASEYRLNFTSSTDYDLVRSSDGQSVASGSMTSFPSQISVDGYTLSVSSASISAGDEYILSPCYQAAKNIRLNLANASQIALASPVRVSQASNNTGEGTIQFMEVTDINNASFATPQQLSPPLRLEFTSATRFNLVNASSGAVIESGLNYDPNQGTDVFPTSASYDPGYRVHLTGPVATGDQFTVDYNLQGMGDNHNGAKLAALQSQSLLEGSRLSLQGSYQKTLNRVAVESHSSEIGRDAAELLMNQYQSKRDSFSGVNLDEEGANLLRYQQVYQASAQVVAVADTVFNTLVSLLLG